MQNLRIIHGNAREKLKEIAPGSVQMIMTSPPYFGLRDYHCEGQIGLEKTPVEYVASLVDVFREARRALRDDGTLWLNLGDSYANDGKWGGHTGGMHVKALHDSPIGRNKRYTGLKPKNLIGIPWRVAFALQEDGWYLRQWMPWVKKNAMPESCNDRPPSSCEIIFLLTNSADYFYDAATVHKQPSEALLKQVADGYGGHSTKDFFEHKAQDASGTKGRIIAGMRKRIDKQRGHSRRHDGFNDRWDGMTKDEQQACGSQRRNGDWFLDSLKGMLTDEDGAPLAFVVNTAPL